MPYPLLGPAVEPFCLPKDKGDVFEDSFDAERDGSLPAGWTDMTAGLYLEKGTLRCPADTSAYKVLNDTLSLGNGCLEWEYTHYPVGPNNFTIASVRYDPIANSGYLFAMWDYMMVISRRTAGTDVDIAKITSINPTKGIVSVEFIGSRLRFYLNGHLVLAANDATYTSGKVAISARAAGFNWFKAVRL